MPKLARWYIKTGIIYLVFALLMGVGMEFPDLSKMSPFWVNLFPTFYHALAVGWITQLIFGVAFWMFPRNSKEDPRGSEIVGWITYICINAGLILRIIFEPFNTDSHWHTLIVSALIISAVLQWLGGVLFAANTWNRVKSRKKRRKKRA
ncbi:MAG TPA: hypothetical protein VKA34_16710 [Balneolales bacterium]|nr:hypothetical protein [Balneolales bacterium]